MADYQFPSNLISYDFWMLMRFFQYRIPYAGGQSGKPLINELGTVRLPLPNLMVDHQDVVYSVEQLGLVAGMALTKFQDSGGGAAGALSGLGGALGGVGTEAIRRLLDKPNIGGTARPSEILLQTQGLAVNPFLSVMFKSPAFRKHAFKWLLAPVSEKETRDLDSIIKYIRYNQLPGRTNAYGGALLSYPNIVLMSVSNSQKPDINNNNSTWSYTFRPAVIESFAANYTPAGQPSHFVLNGAPTLAEITLSLLEIEYDLQEDYGPSSTTGNQNIDNVREFFDRTFNRNPNLPADNPNGSAGDGRNNPGGDLGGLG